MRCGGSLFALTFALALAFSSGRTSGPFSRPDVGVLEGTFVTARALTHLRHLSADFLLVVGVCERGYAKTWKSGLPGCLMSPDSGFIQEVLHQSP